jgi:hypothetical protein
MSRFSEHPLVGIVLGAMSSVVEHPLVGIVLGAMSSVVEHPLVGIVLGAMSGVVEHPLMRIVSVSSVNILPLIINTWIKSNISCFIIFWNRIFFSSFDKTSKLNFFDVNNKLKILQLQCEHSTKTSIIV